jgi:hypothetical protein
MDLNEILIPKIKEFFPEGKEKKDEWWICNPLRPDNSAGSFSINLSSGLWKDFADDSKGNMPTLISKMKGMSVKDLAKEYGCSNPSSVFTFPKLGNPSAIYPYHTIDGKVVVHVCRFETPSGKQIRVHSNGKWSKEGFPKPHPLYNCHKLVQGKKILIVEGEKTCEVAQQILGEDFLVLTWIGGAAAALLSDWSMLKDYSEIYLWPDNDTAGIEAMKKISMKLFTEKLNIKEKFTLKIVNISSLAALHNLPESWDLADCDESWTREKIVSILEQQDKIKTSTQVIPETNCNFTIEHDPRRWLDMWFKSNKFKIKSSEEILKDGETVSIDQVISEMNCDFITYKPEKTRINLPVLRNALDLKITEAAYLSRKKIISSLKYKPDSNDNMKKFIRALIGRDDEIVEAVMKHFIWQVKRKMFGLTVKDHMMPVLYGKEQRQGKSHAVKALLAPINSLWCNAKLCDINDERKAKMFFNYFVALFDEMQGASRIDMEGAKERITSEYISFRALFSNVVSQLRNNSTPIGVTNKPLALILRDHTGMRRFFEIEIPQKCDWDALNKIDFLALWLGVDENLDIPYIELFRKKIESHQELSRDKCSVEQWLEEHELKLGDVRNLLNDVYSHYTHFCRNSGVYPDSKRNFGIKIKSILKIESSVSNSIRYYFLNKFLASILGQYTSTNESTGQCT